MQLLTNLKEYQVDKLKSDGANKAKKALANLEKDAGCTGAELFAYVKVKSLAAAGLYSWVASTIKCYDIFKDVEPKRKKAEEMKKQKVAAEKDLAETEARLKDVTEKLTDLNQKRSIKQAELDELERISKEMTRKLNAASKLITGLGSEQKRWTIDMEGLGQDKLKLVGDCLSGSAFLSYCGAFNFELRQKMVYGKWKADLIEKNIPNKEGFRLEKFLTNDVEISRWSAEGLPSDELSIQNGILTKNASRWPLCVDPQLQAVVWIKEKEKKSNLEILSFNQADYIKRLEMAISFGKPVLFEAIDEEIDPMVDPILEKNIVVQAGVRMIKLGDQNIEYNDDFRLYMTTKIANPNYPPETFGKTMIINFCVTMLGLRDQLLNEVVGFERPELERLRKQLVVETSQNRSTLKELEDTLLSELSKETDIPLVDNVALIETLETAKTKSVEISLAIENAKVTEADIE
jgi:dynein heavy chain